MSAFGVVHKSERKRVPDWATPMLPASTVRAYDYSTRNKKRAGALNFTWKTGASLAGAAAGTLVGAKVLPKLKPFKAATTIAGKTISADMKVGAGTSMAAGAAGGVAGGAAGNASLASIRRNKKKYGYRE